MPVLSPESLAQVTDFKKPSVLEVFCLERIYDSEGFPFTSISPEDYRPGGPQMELGVYPTDDVTERRAHGGVINVTERRNAQEHFGEAMGILKDIRSGYIMYKGAQDRDLTNADVLEIAHMGIELPRYMMWRQQAEYKNGELPPALMLLSRSMRGLHALVSNVTWDGDATYAERLEAVRQPFRARTAGEILVRKELLETKLACAGHWSMITSVLDIVEGSNEPSPVREATAGFVVSDLANFSKGLRSIWSTVFPSIQKAFNGLQDPTDETDTDETEIRAHDEDLALLGRALLTVQTANFLVGRVIGQRPEVITPDQLLDAYSIYAVDSLNRDEGLEARLAEYKAATS